MKDKLLFCLAYLVYVGCFVVASFGLASLAIIAVTFDIRAVEFVRLAQTPLAVLFTFQAVTIHTLATVTKD